MTWRQFSFLKSSPYPTNQIGTRRSFRGLSSHNGKPSTHKITRIEMRLLIFMTTTWEGEAANLWNWYTTQKAHRSVVKRIVRETISKKDFSVFQNFYFLSKWLSNKVLRPIKTLSRNRFTYLRWIPRHGKIVRATPWRVLKGILTISLRLLNMRVREGFTRFSIDELFVQMLGSQKPFLRLFRLHSASCDSIRFDASPFPFS